MLDLTNVIKKSDIITPDKLKPISKKSPKLTGEIMKGVTDVASLIEKIEEYSDDNKLSFGKRIPYTIHTQNNTINVAQAYFIDGKSTLCVVGWSYGGMGTQIYEDGKVTKSIQDVSTYVIPVEHIHCVSFGSYDPEKIKLETPTEVKISEKELEISLNELRNELTALNNMGWDKDFIIKAKIGMTKNYMLAQEGAATLFKNHKILQSSQDIARLYFDKLENIVAYFLNDKKENFMFNYKNDKEVVRKYRFFQTETDLWNYLHEHDSKTGSTDKNTFTFDEVKEFAEFFEDEKITKAVEEQMKLPEKTKVEIKINGSDDTIISVDYYENYEDNPGIPVFRIMDFIPDEDKVKQPDDEYYYYFKGISTKENDTVALSLDAKIMESSTVYPIFKAVPIKEDEEEPPVVEPDPEEPPVNPPVDPDDPDDPDGGDDNGDEDGGEGNEGGDEGDQDEEEPELEPEPKDPEEEDENEEPSDDEEDESDTDGDGDEEKTEE